MKFKRILSLIAATAMVATMQGVAVQAATSYADYVPGDKPANLIPDASNRYGVTYTIVHHRDMDYKYWETDSDIGGYRVKYSYTNTTQPITVSSYGEAWRGASGFWLNRDDTGAGGKSFGFAPEAGKTYVFSANVKNASSDNVTPNFNIAINNSYGPANIIWPNEYGSEGMTLSDSYQKYNATLTMPSDYDCTKAFGSSIAVGLVDGSPVGSAFYIDVASANSMYLAEEQAYDIAVSASEGVVSQGSSFTATSKIVNQVGTVGKLDQTCDWTILDSNRSAVSDGFTVTTNGANATIKVASTVAAGKYYAYAASDYDMGKAVAFTVSKEASYEDYVPGDKPANLIPDATASWQYFGARNSESDNGNFYSTTEGFLTFDYYYPSDSSVTADLTPSDGWRAFSGFWINQGPGGYDGSLPNFAPVGGETYVLSMRLKDASTNGVSPYVGLQMNNSFSPATIVTTNEYGKTGMKVESDWTDFDASITLPEDFAANAKNGDYYKKLIFGFATGTKAGSRIRIDASSKDAVYFAKEEAYDIDVTTSSTGATAGDTVTATAVLKNQVGTAGTLAQDFNWVVLDANRKKVTDGFTIEADGNTANITLANNVAGGKYYIYAMNKADASMGKGVALTVGSYDDYVPGNKPANLIPDASAHCGYTYIGVDQNNINSTYWQTDEDLDDGYYVKKEYAGTAALSMSSADPNWNGVHGFWMNRSNSSGCEKFGFAPQAGETYVFSANVKNASSAGVTPSFGIAINNTYNPSKVISSNEYGLAGMPLTDSYQKFNSTLTFPDDYDCTQAFGDSLSVGFADGAPVGSAFDIDVSSADAIYIAKEQAYDITVECDAESAMSDGTVNVSAQILDQVGLQGKLDQDVSWILLDSSRTPVSGGATFTDTTAGTSVKFNGISSGTYYLFATSDAYDGMGKGVAIVITNIDTTQFKNYVPSAKNANLIPDASAHYGYTYTGVDQSNMDSTYFETDADLDNGYRVKKAYAGTSAVDIASLGEAWKGFHGFWLNRSNSSGSEKFDFAPEAGETYVFSANVKNASSDGVTPNFGIAINNSYGPANIISTNEYGLTGKPLTDKYEKFNATLTFPVGYDSTTGFGDSLSVGFQDGSPVGSAFYLDVSTPDSIYLAKEQVYNITTTADKTIALSDDGYIDVTASVVNQLGEVGTLPQNFEWYVLNQDKEVVSNIEALEISNNEIFLQWYNGSQDDGDYILAARSTDYPTMIHLMNFSIVDNFSDIYVAPNGDDDANGSKDAPLATFAGAVEMVKQYRNANNTDAINVNFASGTYYVAGEELDEDFSQADYGKVVFKAEDGATVNFTSSKTLDLASAKQVTDASVRARLKDSVKDKVVAIDLSSYDLTLVNTWPTMTNFSGSGDWPTLYMDGDAQTLAQWPNGDDNYAKFDYVYEDGTLQKNKLAYGDEKPSSWASVEDAWAGGYFNYDYKYLRFPIEEANSENMTFTLYQYNLDAGMCVGKAKTIAQRYKVFNILEELDTPSEWYIDRNTKMLYYYPPVGATNLELSAFDADMIDIVNADNIGFEGINFVNHRGNAIETIDSNKITVKNCTFKNIGLDAFAMDGTKTAQTDKDYWQVQNIDAGYDCRVEDSTFFNIGGHAIILNGGNVDTLTDGNNVAKNNIITKAAQTVKNYEVIVVKGCGNKVINNNISRAPFQAIRFYGNNHDISYNEIYNVMQETDDCGAIYCGRNTVQRGTEIKYNYIHDLYAVDDLPFGHRVGIYLDDGQTGILVQHNIIKDVEKNFYTNGVDNNYSNNTSINIQTTNMDIKNGGAACNNNTDQDTFGGYIYDTDLYYSTYPNLKTIVESDSLKASSLGKLNIVKNNLSVNGPSGNGIGTNTKGIFGTNSNVSGNKATDDTSIFVDAANQDYRVKSSSSYASTLLNESFDIDLIGTELAMTMAPAKLITPADDGTTATHLAWNDVLGATSYTVLVAEDEDFAMLVASEDVMNPYLDVELEDGTYYWKVIANNTSREFAGSVESDVATLTKGAAASTVDVVATLTDGKVTGTVTNNEYADGVDAIVYVAQYDADGRLVGTTATALTLTYATAVALPEVAVTAAKAKVLVWANNKPLTSAVIVK